MKKEKRQTVKQKKQNKEELAIIKTNTKANVLRVILYTLLIFVFVRGLLSLVRATPGEELVAAQNDFMQSVDSDTAKQVIVSTFSEGFIKNYCTYKKKSEEDYKQRVESFTGTELANDMISGIKFIDDADAVYTQTLSVEKISNEQYDVIVMVDIIYTRYPVKSSNIPVIEPIAPQSLLDNNELAQRNENVIADEVNPWSQKQTLYYKVPVYFKNNKCTIEDYPISTVHPKSTTYQRIAIPYTEISDNRKKDIQTLTDDFMRAIFEESQNKINYYLADIKNINNFAALQTKFVKYKGIQEITVYEMSPDKYLATVTIKTEDINGSLFKQKFTLHVVKKDRYLVENLLLRTHNLNV